MAISGLMQQNISATITENLGPIPLLDAQKGFPTSSSATAIWRKCKIRQQ